MTNEEMIERIVSCEDGAAWRRLDSNLHAASINKWEINLHNISAAGFEVIDRDELEQLRANQVPPGHVCIDPEAPIPGFASEAFDCVATIHNVYGENLYVENTDDAIRAYLRALRDRQKGTSK